MPDPVNVKTSGVTSAGHPTVQNSLHSRQRVRALFLSDVHLGSPHCCPHEFLAMLQSYQPERLYLVGDIIDGRRLAKTWRWPRVYNEILATFSTFVNDGTQIFYTPGNHDEFFREILPHLPPVFRSDRIRIADEFLYESLRRARLLITHGDQFDPHEHAAGLVSTVVTITYDWLLKLDTTMARVLPGRPRRALARLAKGQVRKLREFVESFEETAASYAERGGYDGIICGHVHEPKIVSRGSITYCNTGDWVEHCSALIEHTNGDWELNYFNPKQYPSADKQACTQTPDRPLTWWTHPPRNDVRLTLLKSNRWTHRHSFPEKVSATGCPQDVSARGNECDVASQEE